MPQQRQEDQLNTQQWEKDKPQPEQNWRDGNPGPVSEAPGACQSERASHEINQSPGNDQ